jgi:Flp pilus assembly protein TadG
MSRCGGRSRERGSVSVELALLAPVLLLLLSFAIWAGRTQIARNAVQEAARADAPRPPTRDASLASDAAAAQASATAQARQTLARQDLRCQELDVVVDTAGFRTPLGVSGDVTVSVRCAIAMTDLLAPGLPGSVTVTASFASPVDAFRER